VLVVDDLVAWLISRLADAGYKKASMLLRGSEQARALRQAVTAAVQATAGDLSPAGGAQADRVAMLISGAFGKPVPVKPPARQLTRLEALRAGLAGQLSILDDAGPLADLPGVPAGVVANRLTAHLAQEIMARGAEGGPLTPLADQLNHDLTHLQVEEIKGIVAQLVGKVEDTPTLPGSFGGSVGWPLAAVRDPFALEVHRPVEPDVWQHGLSALPAYLPREHDAALAEVVAAAAAGISGIAVLVGGSSTGKTRACWQALELLRGQQPSWRLWHPIDPSRPQAALDELPGIEPQTVVWLNDAQYYLSPSDGVGERVSAGLRELLRSPDRGPVLVLATLWPQFWDQLTTRPPGDADPHAQSRELLAGHDIAVPAAFTPVQLQRLGEIGDPRLAQAAANSRDGQVIQYLAGAPELLARYRNAPPAARALVHVAMDARRLGMRPALPLAFLATAAPGYLTGTQWDLLAEDWLDQALAYTATPCKGVRGPLTAVRRQPASGAAASHGAGSACQLADYLDQYGRRIRREVVPPPDFWAAAASHADPAIQVTLGEAADDRGLYRDAARLYKKAGGRGSSRAAARLLRLLHTLHPADQRPADWAAAHTTLDDPRALAELLGALRAAGATAQVAALLGRDPAAHVSLDDPRAVAELLGALWAAGATGQVATLANRIVDTASLDDPAAVAELLGALRAAGATAQVAALLRRDPAAHVTVGDPRAVAELLGALRAAGATAQAAALLGRDPAAHASLEDPHAVAELLGALRGAGATSQVAALLGRDPAAHASPGNPGQVAVLLDALRAAGATAQVTTLANHVAAEASLHDPLAAARLLDALRTAGATAQATKLLDRDPATHASLRDPLAVARLLDVLRDVRAITQVRALLDRDPATHASLHDPYDVAGLLKALWAAGATAQATKLLDRDPAAHASLDAVSLVAELLAVLREAGTRAHVATLIERLPGAGMFQLFCEQANHGELSPFGREADGRPAEPWGWQDLD
jgi:hypothetical protein